MQLHAAIRKNLQLLQFVFFGCVAAAVHLASAAILIYTFGWPAAVANVGAWLIAFCVSFACHFRFTFGAADARIMSAVTRFFLVSATGFLVGELAYVEGLSRTNINPIVLLFFILVVVAACTFLLSRYWAFVYRR